MYYIKSTPSIQHRAEEVAKAIGLELISIDQTSIFDQLSVIVEKEVYFLFP